MSHLENTFSVILNCFTAPRVIIYDNSCNLLNYCFNREPELFKSTFFFVDRFHMAGHVNCSKSFDLRAYKHLKGLYSQAAEQVNSRLVTLKNMASFMTQANFMFFVRYFCLSLNEVKLANMSKMSSAKILSYQ